MPNVSDREQQIGRRIREFRESLRISRSAFAVAIGMGSERLASYEAGRVPIRFEVFMAIHEKFFINPAWLAEGEEPQAYDSPVEWGRLLNSIGPKWLFTAAYDRALSHFHRGRRDIADAIARRICERTNKLIEVLRAERDVNATKDIALLVAARLGELDRVLKDLANLDLTETSLKSSVAPVKDIRTISELLDSLRALTAHPGGPAALANDLDVPQARVSEWLSGKKEPGGANTFRLLQWVEQQERPQTKSPGSVSAPPERKTRKRKSLNENLKSSPPKP